MIQIGVDGIILLRLTDVKKSTDYVQGNTYYGGWGYGGWGYGGAMLLVLQGIMKKQNLLRGNQHIRREIQ